MNGLDGGAIELGGRLVALGLALGAIVLVGIYTVLAGVPPTPPGRRLRAAAYALLPDGRDVQGPVYDLGSAWGGFALGVARRYARNPVRGIELSPLPWLVARARAALTGPKNVAFLREDFFKRPLGDAGLVVCYLFPAHMKRLEAKLAGELAPGTPVVSLVFAFPTWRPERVLETDDLYRSKVYFYRAP